MEIRFIVIGLLVLFSNISLCQSGWTQEKGNLYAQTGLSIFGSDNYFGLDGTKNPIANKFRQQAVNLYAEYGWTSRLTVLLNAPILRFNSFSSTDVVASPGDLRIGLKYALSTKLPLSLSISPEFPIGKKDNFATAKEANELGFKEQVNLATTDGEINFWSVMAASSSFLHGKAWGSIYGGYNLRTKGFSDQIQTGVELGYKPFSKLYIKGTVGVLESIGSFKENVPFFRGEGTEYMSASIGFGYELGEHWGLLGEFWRSFDLIKSPRNAYLGSVLNFGVSYKINVPQ